MFPTAEGLPETPLASPSSSALGWCPSKSRVWVTVPSLVSALMFGLPPNEGHLDFTFLPLPNKVTSSLVQFPSACPVVSVSQWPSHFLPCALSRFPLLRVCNSSFVLGPACSLVCTRLGRVLALSRPPSPTSALPPHPGLLGRKGLHPGSHAFLFAELLLVLEGAFFISFLRKGPGEAF